VTAVSFALQYAIEKVRTNQEGWRLNGRHQLLVYSDDVNMIGGNILTIKKNAGSLLASGRKIGLEANSLKTKYVPMTPEHNAGLYHNTGTGSKPFQS
jgi:hypothetical protein